MFPAPNRNLAGQTWSQSGNSCETTTGATGHGLDTCKKQKCCSRDMTNASVLAETMWRSSGTGVVRHEVSEIEIESQGHKIYEL
jgi:hypothetical protein